MELTFNEDINRALKVLREGGIILYPTDTVWGLGCDATNAQAVEKIYRIKHRADSKSMLSLVGSEGQLQQWVDDIPETAWQLIDVAVHPLTIIYDSPRGIATNLIAEDGSAGFRITSERFSQELCLRLRCPVVSTSANISGEKTPHNFENIDNEIKDVVDYIVEHGRDNIDSTPSNIIKVTRSGVITVIR